MGHDWQGPDPAQVMAIAKDIIGARLAGEAKEAFPSPYPADLITAYRIQEAAITMMEPGVAGWLLQPISPNHAQALKSDYTMGPVFDGCVHKPKPFSRQNIRCFKGGANVISAQWIVTLKAPAPADRFEWSPEDALLLIGHLHIGLVITGSPFRTLENYGPAAIAADVGGMCDLILGPEIGDWPQADLGRHRVHWSTGQSQALYPGNLTDIGARLAFALLHTNARNRPMPMAALVALGHDEPAIALHPGQSISADFGALGRFDVDAS